MQFWNELEGRTIDGRHPLRRLVRSEGRRAWFESEAGDPQATPATLSLTEALTDADEVVARLQAAQSMNHPNLVTIVKIGQVNLDNTLFVYAVMEHIEQSLSDVLQSQALSAEEGREVAEAMVGALTVIHQKGMSHGHVEAASVLATEETVKLRSDCLQDSTAGQADDVAGIGATLFHAFTQRKGLSATDAQINRIPAPFAEIVRSSFARRWNLAQVANALKPAPPVMQAAPPPPPPPPPPRGNPSTRAHRRQSSGEDSSCVYPSQPPWLPKRNRRRWQSKRQEAFGRQADPPGALCWARRVGAGHHHVAGFAARVSAPAATKSGDCQQPRYQQLYQQLLRRHRWCRRPNQPPRSPRPLDRCNLLRL